MLIRNKKIKRAQGFTLLETLVALAILALSLGVIYQIFGVSLKNIQHARDYSYAQMLAESKLSEIGKGIPVIEGSYGGNVGQKYIWKMDVIPLHGDDSDEQLIYTYQVKFTISWMHSGKGRTIAINTYRLSTGEV